MANPATPPEPELRGPSSSLEALEDHGAPLIVLEERHLDEPVEDAVKRLRADPKHHGSRILVIGREVVGVDFEPGPVLRPRETVPSRARPDAGTAPGSVEDAIARTGERWLALEQIMDQWMTEHATVVRSLEDSLSTSDLDELTTNVRRMWELHRWMQATLDETLYVANKAVGGMEPISCVDVLRDAAVDLHGLRAGFDIKLPSLDGSPKVYARASDLRKAFLVALQLVAERQAWTGCVRIEVEEGNFFVLHRFLGQSDGERAEVPGHLADRLRHLIVDRHRGLILPGPDGPTGTSLVIALPKRCIEFLSQA